MEQLFFNRVFQGRNSIITGEGVDLLNESVEFKGLS